MPEYLVFIQVRIFCRGKGLFSAVVPQVKFESHEYAGAIQTLYITLNGILQTFKHTLSDQYAPTHQAICIRTESRRAKRNLESIGDKKLKNSIDSQSSRVNEYLSAITKKLL
jgi:hypothetical protein